MKISELTDTQRFIVDNMAVMYHRGPLVKISIYFNGQIIPGVLARDEDGQSIAFPSDIEVRIIQ